MNWHCLIKMSESCLDYRHRAAIVRLLANEAEPTNSLKNHVAKDIQSLCRSFSEIRAQKTRICCIKQELPIVCNYVSVNLQNQQLILMHGISFNNLVRSETFSEMTETNPFPNPNSRHNPNPEHD